ncbi:hypothetical protein POM88_034015 [Heracleum sosnowskyi]|uniref:Uncharacterized protein n=1 Tax=Heracleum sosnowskyi TaxID=360622 RepID=A0AAD8MD70_9APIA|nr:hypothetical protein POM88_034015 [Heracleum sosnowskyi]
MFPEWINQSRGSTVSLDLPPNVSHNFLGIILCSRIWSSDKESYSVNVKTNTNDCVWRHGLPSWNTNPDDYTDTPRMILEPRTVFSITDSDESIEFTASMESRENNTVSTESGEITGFHLLYKGDECDSTAV